MKKITIVIVTYNSEDHIYDCLNSVFEYNDIGDELEVIIVDNCSIHFDQMKKRIYQEYRDKVLVIENVKNGGYGQGNNVGIYASHSPVIMVMNPDVRLSEPLFSKVSKAFDENQKIVMYGMKQFIPGYHRGYAFDITFRFPIYLSAIITPIVRKFNIYSGRYMYFTGSCFFVRKTSFMEVGMYDENIFMYCEEDDLHSRLLKIKDAKFLYDKGISYQHLHIPETKNLDESYKVYERTLNSSLYWNIRDGFSKEYVIRKHIQMANVFIVRERLRSLFGHCNKEFLSYMLNWKKRLIQTIQ